MINRAKWVLPGMVASVLFSMPALAANTDDAQIAHEATEAKSSTMATQQHGAPRAGRSATSKPDHEKTQRKSVAPRVATSKPAGANTVSPHSSTASRSKARSVSPALSLGSNGRVIRRVSASQTSGNLDPALIDDGTLWREQGSVATWQQTGMASWYGGARWQGQRTSAGTRYDQNALTAAHATLPLGTKVRVTSHNGARAVIVTINDRPGTRTRIIDLSRQAAKELGILDAGVGMVTLQPL